MRTGRKPKGLLNSQGWWRPGVGRVGSYSFEGFMADGAEEAARLWASPGPPGLAGSPVSFRAWFFMSSFLRL